MARDEVTKLIEELASLTLRANEIAQELQTATNRRDPRTARTNRRPTFEHGFELGDRAVITNAYHGQQHTQGTVTRITKHRITITDAQGNKFTRAPTNLRKL
jgi:hypothetical protein